MAKKLHWTDEEIEYLKQHYNSMPIEELSEKMGIDYWSIIYRVGVLGIGKQFRWTKEKIEILKEYYPRGDWQTLFEKLGTNNKQTIMDKDSSLKISMESYFWSKEEIEYLKNNYNILTPKEIAEKLGKPSTAIVAKASKMGLSKESYWTKEQTEKLKKLYPYHSNKFLAENVFIGKTKSSIYGKAHALNLKKNSQKGLKTYYNKELILQQLRDVANQIGRTPLYNELTKLGLPSEKTFDRLFGSYRKAIIMANLPINAKLWGNPIVKYADNGDPCFSIAELSITNFLVAHNIEFIKEPLYKDYIDDKRCLHKRADWKVGDCFIEYFGFLRVPSYEKKMKEKIKICQENNFKLIALYPEDMKRLEEKLKPILNQKP